MVGWLLFPVVFHEASVTSSWDLPGGLQKAASLMIWNATLGFQPIVTGSIQEKVWCWVVRINSKTSRFDWWFQHDIWQNKPTRLPILHMKEAYTCFLWTGWIHTDDLVSLRFLAQTCPQNEDNLSVSLGCHTRWSQIRSQVLKLFWKVKVWTPVTVCSSQGPLRRSTHIIQDYFLIQGPEYNYFCIHSFSKFSNNYGVQGLWGARHASQVRSCLPRGHRARPRLMVFTQALRGECDCLLCFKID